MRAYQYVLAVGLVTITHSAFAALADDVGDADSFGRQVKYIGAKSSDYVYVEKDCTVFTEAGSRCVTINPDGTGPIDQATLLTFKLPAFSTRSLICFSYFLNASYRFTNLTTVKQQSAYVVRPTYTITSTVLNNPSIIDPFTGLPANGKISSILNSYQVSRTVAPGESELQSQSFSRECIGGIVNKPLLQAAGMTTTQINAFFANPITITIGSAGSATRLDYGSYAMGFRLFGD